MHADDLVVDQCGDWQAVETLCEHLPKFDVVSPFALVVKSVDSVDGCTLVVASQEEEVLWILDLIGEEQTDGLDIVFAAIDIVAQKEVVRVRGKFAVLEESKQVVILSVNVAFVNSRFTTDLQRRFEFEQDRLRHENVS